MNLIETLVAKATEEACELGKALSKLNFMGIKATDPESGEPLTLDAIKQLNEILACVELLRDRGIPLAGIGDPVAIGEAKGKIVQDMEEAMKAGTLVLSEDDQNPRPEGVNEADNGMPEDGAGGGDGDQNNGEGNGDEEGLGADGTDPNGADGTADDTGAGDGDGTDGLGDGAGGDDDQGGGEEEESEDDSSDDDSGTGDDDGDSSDDESSEEEEEESEEEEEPGSNDV
ncbi:hypothetical protein D3C85_273160 [compost metagenome]